MLGVEIDGTLEECSIGERNCDINSVNRKKQGGGLKNKRMNR